MSAEKRKKKKMYALILCFNKPIYLNIHANSISGSKVFAVQTSSARLNFGDLKMPTNGSELKC